MLRDSEREREKLALDIKHRGIHKKKERRAGVKVGKPREDRAKMSM